MARVASTGTSAHATRRERCSAHSALMSAAPLLIAVERPSAGKQKNLSPST